MFRKIHCMICGEGRLHYLHIACPSLSHPTAVIFWDPLSVTLSNLTMSGVSFNSFSSVRSQLSRINSFNGYRLRLSDNRSMENICQTNKKGVQVPHVKVLMCTSVLQK